MVMLAGMIHHKQFSGHPYAHCVVNVLYFSHIWNLHIYSLHILYFLGSSDCMYNVPCLCLMIRNILSHLTSFMLHKCNCLPNVVVKGVTCLHKYGTVVQSAKKSFQTLENINSRKCFLHSNLLDIHNNQCMDDH